MIQSVGVRGKTMTIDERVEQFEPFKDSAAWKTYLRSAFLEVARDQRRTCAEAVNALEGFNIVGEGPHVSKHTAHTTIMNAETPR